VIWPGAALLCGADPGQDALEPPTLLEVIMAALATGGSATGLSAKKKDSAAHSRMSDSDR
jgi:hypothetical protein